MSATVVDQIIGAVVTALQAGTPPAGLTVDRYRTLPIDQGALPRMVVYPIQDEQLDRVGTGTAPVSERRLTFCVECRAKCPANDSIDDALDPLIVWAVKALNVDPTFGGLVAELQQHLVTWAAADLDEIYGGAAVDFTARFSIVAADPTKTGN